jgi:hypothetical protein
MHANFRKFTRIVVFLVLILLGLVPGGEAEEGRLRKTARLLNALAPRLSVPVAQLALDASHCAAEKENQGTPEKLAVIDYTLPSTEKRFWLFDLRRGRLLMEDLVAHGKNTGEDSAGSFSNEPGSLQSSLGLFSVGESYVGKHGKALRLFGLEPGVNDLAYERAIVLHGADYVSPHFIKAQGRLGRSFGCPVLSVESAETAIDILSEGTSFLFAYYPDSRWLKSSQYLNGCRRL